jgi:hypothetical protein
MKLIYFAIPVCLLACDGNTSRTNTTEAADSLMVTDSVELVYNGREITAPVLSKVYANDRFREVTVEKVGGQTYKLRGEAQIFEANFGWVVEDGHNELKQGNEMTTAGAPEWGAFEFTVEVEKERENSTLTLVLFESSAKDGSKQHELSIPLN